MRVAMPKVNRDDFNSYALPIPNKNEQQKIIQWIECEINRIDSDVHNYLKEISLLREYRQSLISEAVTGKIDVRDYPVPTEESMEEAVAKDA
jgi:type I restriction enzyme S subunit